MSYVAAGVAGAGILGKGITGLFQKAQANRIAKSNPFPTAFVQPEYTQNVALAENMAQVGLPQQQYNNQLNSIDRSQSGGLSTLGRSANPSAGLASLIRAGNDATMNLNSADASARQRNLMTFMQQRQILGGQRQSVWDWNHKQKYLSNLEKEQALRGAGNQNLMGAFGDATSLGSQLMGMQNGDAPQQQSFSQTSPAGLPAMQTSSSFPNRMFGNMNQYNPGVQWGMPFQQ